MLHAAHEGAQVDRGDIGPDRTGCPARRVSRSAEAGTIPLLSASTRPDAPTGVFLGLSLRRRDNRVVPGEIRPPADDPARAAALWRPAEEVTGVRYLSAVSV